ncbi:Z1 domain-containing protein [Calothrix sp. CCY 0018]|uniref:Z1 domain-containing protein n=1 Tax=Calothrix sp. CCY 0018 TaxID=3103864 RepID=UPI0039C6D2A3
MSNCSKTVEIMETTVQTSDSNRLWSPVIGEETQVLLNHLGLPDEESRNRIQNEAIQVMEKCVPPTSLSGSKTGIVNGLVQAGKTMGFTTVTALACDNGYRMVIVIAGTKTNLFNQSNKRLTKDLRLDIRSDRKWKYFENPRENKRRNIQSTLDTWNDSSVPEDERQIALLTVMKQNHHLQHLKDLLGNMDLQGVPVLIIDDEADQAGLNNKVNQGQISTIYRHLIELRQRLPHHSFLQYTATPQAPLLINIVDLLSPDFAEVLTPGADYTGGKEFFLENPKLIKTIPSEEIPTKNNEVIETPESFLYAMRLFYLGVAAGYVQDKGRGNRSMMVHPSQKTAPHGEYFHWARQVNNQWKKIISEDTKELSQIKLLGDFNKAYQDLVQTVPDLPSFEELVNTLPRAINQTNIQEINATGGKTPQIDWRNEYAHILIGGQAMDRGFTVEGLTVSYMPRGAGVGNADTLQQRARFFGYKRSYLGYCRVFLEQDVKDAFISYVEHEEEIREQLKIYGSRPLSDWKRAFLMGNALKKPTRKNVLDLPLMRGGFSNDWYAPNYPHDSDENVINTNRELVDKFWSHLTHMDEKQFGKILVKKHSFATDIPLQKTFEQLIINFRTTHPSDSLRLTGLILQVGHYLKQNPDELCDIYFIDKGNHQRKRTVGNSGKLNLFQGRDASSEPGKYPGDRKIKVDDKLTIQIHKLKLHLDEEEEIDNVRVIAIWVPKKMELDWVIQNQGGVL